MVRYIFSGIIGYLLGSISTSLLLSKQKYGQDVRKLGSGNAGATNVARVFGMNAGVMTLLGDMGKTALSGLTGFLLGGKLGLVVTCAACLIGHCWPVYYKFRGGKGVSVSACIALLMDWRMFLILAALFFLVFLASRRVSLCSIVSAAVCPALYILLGHRSDAGFIVCCMVTVIVLFLHRGNIRRLLAGTEAKFKPGSKPVGKKGME